MNNNSLSKIINHYGIGYSLCEVVCDSGRPINFKFLEANDIFREIIGLENPLEVVSINNYLFNHEDIINNCLKFVNKKNNGEFSILSNDNKKIYKFEFFYIDEKTFALTISPENIIINETTSILDKSLYYEKIINSMNDLVWIMDLDFRFTYFSPSVNTILGYSEDELMGKTIYDVLCRSNVENVLALYNQAIKKLDKEHWVIEITQTHKNGEMVVMEYMVRFLKDSEHNIIGVMGVGRNITSWISAKSELKKSEESLSLLLNSTAEGIFGVDNKGIITFVNQSCLDLLGYTDQSALINKHVKVIMGIDINEEFFLDRFSDVFEKGIGSYYEVDQYVKADGSSFIAEYYIYPQTSNNEVIGSVITFFDITEKVKTQNELYEAERSKSVLIANLPGLAYRCDFDEHYTMRYVSDGCYTLTGYLPDSFINNRDISFNDIIVPKYRDRIRRKLELMIGKDEIFKEEYEIICADGSTKWVLEQCQIIYDETKEVVALEGMLIDINDQKIKQAEIEYLSSFDSLTGLRNRFSYDKAKLTYHSEEYLPVSIIVGDINGLKIINDALGHNEGDKMIVDTANLLVEVIEDRNIIFRTSGDEFSIMLPNTDSEAAYEIMKKISARIDEHNENIYSELLKIHLALGFATLTTLDLEFKDIARVAEDYMYKRKLNDRKSSHSTIISYIKSAMYERSQITEEHAERLIDYSTMMGHALNLSQVELDELVLVSTLHDIGKIGIDDRILTKPDKLTEEEWIEMKKHPEIGFRICMSSPELMSIAPYVLSHHERWDGKGYPNSLKGEEIPLIARIISIVDAYDAMTEDRPYRRAMNKEDALMEIEKNSGTQFDPKLAKLFIKLMKKDKRN